MRGVKFSDSPGILAFQNITDVRIEDCSFMSGMVLLLPRSSGRVQLPQHDGPQLHIPAQRTRLHCQTRALQRTCRRTVPRIYTAGPSNVNGGVSNFARFENCTFSGNTAQFGAAIGMITVIIFQSTENIRPFQIHSCTFLENDGDGGGAVGTAYLPLSFSGSNLWQGNRGRTLVLLGAHNEDRGTMQFTANNGEGIDGGALYVTSLSQMELFQNSSFSFDNNIGVLGAAIVVDAHAVPQPFSQLQHNPLCFVLYEDPEEEPDNWDNVAFSFYGNRAVVASAVYLNNLRLCSWVRDRDLWLDEEKVFRWTFVNFTVQAQVLTGKYNPSTTVNTAHTPDELNPVWYLFLPIRHRVSLLRLHCQEAVNF